MRLSCFPPCPNLWDFSDTDPGISLTRESTWKPCTSLYSRTLLNCLLLNIAEDARGSHWLLKHTKPINLHAQNNTTQTNEKKPEMKLTLRVLLQTFGLSDLEFCWLSNDSSPRSDCLISSSYSVALTKTIDQAPLLHSFPEMLLGPIR